MKRVLIPTDFSIAAWNATNYALRFFKDCECVFYVLNTYTPIISNSRFMADNGQQQINRETSATKSDNELRATLKRIKKNLNNPLHTFKTISSFSLLIDEVKDTILDYDIDLIVMGANGLTDKETVFMGSNTVRMLKAVHNCPVLVVPKKVEFHAPKRIAFAVDFNRFYNKLELAPLIEMADIFSASVKIIMIQDHQRDLSELQLFNYNALNKNLESIAHNFHKIDSASAVALREFISTFNIQILTMSNNANSLMDGLCRELVITRSVFDSDVPVLVIPEMERRVFFNREQNQVLTNTQ